MPTTEQTAYATIDDAKIALKDIRPGVAVFVDAPYGQQLQGYTALKADEGVAVNKLATLAFDSAFLDALVDVLDSGLVALERRSEPDTWSRQLRLAESILARLGGA